MLSDKPLPAPVNDAPETSIAPVSEPSFDFFLSFAGQDSELAHRAKDLLTNFGYRVIYQDDNFQLGDSFLANMDHAHLSCRKVIVLLTPNYFANSQHTRHEFEAALLDQKLLIFRFQGARVPPSAYAQTFQDFPDEFTSVESVILLERAAKLQPTRSASMVQRVHLDALPQWQGSQANRDNQLLIGRDRELAQLTKALADVDTSMVCVIAGGGFGKSALVRHWLREQAATEYGNKKVVYGYSFYKQGFEGGSGVLTRPFFLDCLSKLTGRSELEVEATNEKDWPQQILNFLRTTSALLILDGLEPHQVPKHVAGGGNISDKDLNEFMSALIHLQNNGLCIVTSRIMPQSLVHDRTVQINLGPLDHASSIEAFVAAGLASTCQDLDVWATKSGGHPLLISLLAPAIESGHYDPQMFTADQVITEHNTRDIPETVQNVVATRLIQLGPEARAIMFCVSLFGRAVTYGELRSEVLDCKRIPLFTEPLYNAKESRNRSSQALFSQGVEALTKAAIVTAQGSPQQPDRWVLEAHPLVQAGVRCDAETKHRELWKSANWTVYKSITGSVKDKRPEEIDDLRRLYSAVPHGVQAGRGKLAGWMYARRCLRGFRAYSTNRGMVADDVALISHYFKGNWLYPRQDIGLNTFARIQSYVWAGVLLTAVNRAEDGIPLIDTGLKEARAARSFSTAARTARFLGVLFAMQGKLQDGEKLLRSSLADLERTSSIPSRIIDFRLVDKDFQRMASHTMLASILHEQGRFSEAEASFGHAELIQRKATRFTGLRNIWCYRKVDFLYDAERFDEARAALIAASVDAEEPKGWGEGVFVDVILQLSRIRGAVREADLLGIPPDPQVLNQGEIALKRLEMDQGARMDWLLPVAKIAIAGKARLTGSLPRAENVLSEAEVLIRKSGNIIFQVDLLMERSRLHIASNETSLATAAAQSASELANSLGYSCRATEIGKLQDLCSAR